jgi:UDP-N-acetyl-D-glucosamine/UDP-N-acetyl-D-galactosamine dehydrogenase
MEKNIRTVGVIGLGYVGLPLAISFAKRFEVVGYDIDKSRIHELREGYDRTHECPNRETIIRSGIDFTSAEEPLKSADVFIVTVPTPIDQFKNPDLKPLRSAARLIGRVMRRYSLVIFESTVFPGATEEVCVPLLEAESGLKLNESFYCGYSPERINPGDEERKFESILKVVAGSNDYALGLVSGLYEQVVDAGVYKASSIKVAEAAKVIENTQRDVNIALINELSLLFEKMGIDTKEVLDAAGTKWNFMPFWPGLVGGHCIGVDPYYLTHKAQSLGFNPEIILAGRRLNDEMPKKVAVRAIKEMLKGGINPAEARVLAAGYTFKENCPDTRNTKVEDVCRELSEYGCSVDVFDPYLLDASVLPDCSTHVKKPTENSYDMVVLAVAHSEFLDLGSDYFRGLCNAQGLIVDLKYMYAREEVDVRL